MILKGPFGTFEGTFDECIRMMRVHAGLRAYLNGTDLMVIVPRSPIQRFEDGLSRYRERSSAEPKILLLSPRDIDRMEKLMREGVRFPMGGEHKYPGWHMRFNGIELGGSIGVEEGTVVVCAADFQVLGAFAWDWRG